VEDAGERRERRVVSRDPVIRRLQRQAARLREKLQRVRAQKQRESLEQVTSSHSRRACVCELRRRGRERRARRRGTRHLTARLYSAALVPIL
jgi:hypothetical protein